MPYSQSRYPESTMDNFVAAYPVPSACSTAGTLIPCSTRELPTISTDRGPPTVLAARTSSRTV